MKIKSFSVKNFRSITSTNELPLYDYSILLGPNNEGKSNILKAFVMAQNIISTQYSIEEIIEQLQHYKSNGIHIGMGRYRRRKFMEEDELNYSWTRDFPISLQKKKENKSTEFTTVYELTRSEKNSLKKIIRKTLSGDLKFMITIGLSSVFMTISDTDFPKKKIASNGKISRLTNYKMQQFMNKKIQLFMNKKIQVQYISAIRTPDQTVSIVENMIASQLSDPKYNKKYQDVLEKLEKIHKPILEELSQKLTNSVSTFLPQVKNIKIDSKKRFQRLIRESAEVYINDGTNTPLDQKGDGIKSLIVISIIQHITNQSAQKKNIVLVIEEPESHLHPDAIHKVNDVLEEISRKNQVIISTHSALLVNRSDVSRNILVDKSQATESKSISQIRKILGVEMADNLHSANLVILVEGEDDKKILKQSLIEMSDSINKAITNGVVTFDTLGGGSNLSHKISLWKSFLCDVYAFLDNDTAGINSFDDAEDKGLITSKYVSFAIIQSQKESEIEDLIDPEIYNQDIFDQFGVDLKKSLPFKNKKQKWSVRVKNSFKASSKPWNKKIESKVKNQVSTNFQKIGIKGLQKNKTPINSLVTSIEEYLEKNQKNQK